MPQKPVFSRSPVLPVPYAFLSNGLIRTDDKRIEKLFYQACKYSESPFLWEGLFSIACLITKDPLTENVSDLIRNAVQESEDGSFNGSVSEQIHIARAAFSLYEYNTDRSILKRLAKWFRYLEIEFGQLSAQDGLLYTSADLMELLVKYYLVTGLKSVLRLCALLRAASFDWTTALHTFQQSIPVQYKETDFFSALQITTPDILGYYDKEKLINHAELLADGMRYTLYSGLYSGNTQDLSAGKKVWQYLIKRHRAICGGTTSNPYFCGKAANNPVDKMAIMAWAEAFASQMNMKDYHWAADELVRILFNAIDTCLNNDEPPGTLWLNCTKSIKKNTNEQDQYRLYGRLTRAVACAYQHAVTVMRNGIRINYTLPCRMILSIRNQPVILHMTEQDIRFQCDEPFQTNIDIYIALTETAVPAISSNNKTICSYTEKTTPSDHGYFIHTNRQWLSGDSIHFVQKHRIYSETTNHQGICFFLRNRLMSLPVAESFIPVAACDMPFISDGKVYLKIGKISHWKEENGLLHDIPVLPEITDDTYIVILSPYSGNNTGISMFPRGRKHG